jgi:hypothetical protein
MGSLHAMNEDDPDGRLQFCAWFQHKVHENEEFASKIVCSDEATFKLNGAANRHNYVCGVARTTTVPPPFYLTALPFDKVALAFM